MLCGWRIKRMRRKKERPTYLLSTLTEAQVLSILAKKKQQQKKRSIMEFSTTTKNHKIFCPFLKIIRNLPLSLGGDVMWCGLPSSGWMGVLQVRGGKAKQGPDPIVPCSD